MWLLAVTLGSDDQLHFPLPPGHSTVGRSDANLIRILDETVSSAHAELVEIGPGKYRLRDLGSTNGTFVNDSAVSEIEISAPCNVTFGSVRCQLSVSSAPGDTQAPSELIEKQRAIGSHAQENDDLKLTQAEILETPELARGSFADQLEALTQQGEQAAREAQKESASIKQALEEVNTRLTIQEQEHKRELSAAIETERKESERLSSDRAAQLKKLEAANEAYRLRVRELLSQNTKTEKEIERWVTSAEQSKKTMVEKDQALRAAENEAGLSKKALYDLGTRFVALEEDFKQKLDATEARQLGEMEALAQKVEQAAQAAEKESAAIKQALEEARAKLSFQEQEHKQELIAAIETERKEREKIDLDHAVQLTKLEAENEAHRLRAQELLTQNAKAQGEVLQLATNAGLTKKAAAEAEQQGECDPLNQGQADQLAELQSLNETQRHHNQELHDQIKALRKKHPRAIERLESTQHADLVTSSNGHEKPSADLADRNQPNISYHDRAFGVPELQSPEQSDPRQTKRARPQHSNQSVASTQKKLKKILNALPTVVRTQSAAMATSYLLTFVFGCFLSTAASKKHDLHQAPKHGTHARQSTMTATVATSPSPTFTPGTVASLPPGASAEPTEGDQRVGKHVSNKSTTAGSQLPVLTTDNGSASQVPPLFDSYQVATALVARSIGANPLLLLSAQWPAAVEPPGVSAGVKDTPAFSEQNTVESSRLLAESEGASVNLDNLSADLQRSDIINSNASTDTGDSAPPLSPVVFDPPSSPNTFQPVLQPDSLWTSAGKGGYAKSDTASAGGYERRLFNFDGTKLGLSSTSFAGPSFDLASLSFPSVDRRSQSDRITTAKGISEANIAPEPTPLTVLILGDSMSLCGFGKRLDDHLRIHPQIKSTFTYMASGTNPLSWLKEKPYANARTHSGFWSIETAQGQEDPKVLRDTYGMRRGSIPKWHQVPKLEDLLSTNRPDILIVQNGTNLFDLFRDGRTVQPQRQGPLLKHYIEPFIDKLFCPTSSVRKVYWVSSPTSGRVSKEIQEFVFEQLRVLSGNAVTVIDSRQLVSYPYRNMAPDREHFIGKDMDQWADKVYDIIQKDLSSQSLSALKPLRELPLGSGPDQSHFINGKSRETDLYVSATLTFKSEPLKVKALLPYQDSLVAYVYAVRQVLDGEYDEKEILVMHPAHIGLKSQSLRNYQIGKSYNLRLRELETTQWSTVKSKDDSGAIDLTPYIQTEDDLRIQEHSHGTANNTR